MDTIEKAIQRLNELGAASAASRSIAANAVEVPPPVTGAAPAEPQSVAAAPVPAAPVPAAPVGSSECARRSISLDLEHLRQVGMLVPDDRRSRIKEEYRHIKRPLLMNASGKGALVNEYSNLIMVTSAAPGEGKTFTALNLALSIASERDRTVLLVDADVVRPSLSEFFGLYPETGLVDFLIEDGLDLAEILVDTNIPSLSVLPAGNTHHLSTELLASKAMRQLVREMSQRYPDRIVIFDSPPLLATSEASVLANLVGQIVMVVEAEKTRQTQLKEALAMVDAANVAVGFVLNKARKRSWDYYGYGYYGYGYYGYYDPKE